MFRQGRNGSVGSGTAHQAWLVPTERQRNDASHGRQRGRPDSNDLDLAHGFANRMIVFWAMGTRIAWRGRMGADGAPDRGARAVVERGLEAELQSGLPVIVGRLLGGGQIRIHEDSWGDDLTCHGTRAGGIFNGSPSIYE